MLTKDKLDRILRFPSTIEDKLIKIVHEHKGCLKLKELSELSSMSTSLVCLHVKKSFYLEKDKELIVLKRKGKESKSLYKEPLNASSIHDFVFSLLYKDYSINFKRSIDKVSYFCGLKGFSITGYLQNPNIFSTIKKEVKKYKLMDGTYTGD